MLQPTWAGRLALVIALWCFAWAQPADGAPPSISPVPQELRSLGRDVDVGQRVRLVTGQRTDPAAIDVVESAVREAGVRDVVHGTAGGHAAITVWIGGPSENASSAGALSALGVAGPSGLPEEGYVLAAGRADGSVRVVLAGVDAAGTFRAAQSFRQLLAPHGRLPAVEVRDWPSFPVRGGMEVHYGPAWTHEDRMRQIAFYGRQKLNLFGYGTGEDPFTQTRWRDPYPPDQLAALADEVALAERNHVTYRFHMYPSVSGFVPPTHPARICYSDEGDFAALEAKAQQLWDIGVRSFAIGFDDISTGFRCAQDTEQFGVGPAALAAAQAHVLNRFNREFVATHPGAERLTTVPVEYFNTQPSPYRERLAELLDADIIVMWTGTDVIAPTITAAHVDAAFGLFRHDLLLFDNYPVNDYARDRLFLGPVTGRDAALPGHTLGLNANTMNEAEASKIPLFTVADYTWNPRAYDPERSWRRSLEDFGGPARDALRTFAENSRSSLLDTRESPVLTPLVASFKRAVDTGDETPPNARRLLEELRSVAAAPSILRDRLDNARFLEEAAPYLDKLERYGAAGVASMEMFDAQRSGAPDEAWRERLRLERASAAAVAIPQRIATEILAVGRHGPGLFEPFYDWSRRRNDVFFDIVRITQPGGTPWTPVEYDRVDVHAAPPASGGTAAAAIDGDPATAYRADRAPRTGETLTVTLPYVHRLDRLRVLQDPETAARASVEARTPGGTWRRIGQLDGGHTAIALRGMAADALRLVWSPGSRAPVIHEIVPVYADALPVRVAPRPDRVIATPGMAIPIVVALTPLTNEALAGTLRATAPDGWTAEPAAQPFAIAGGAQTASVDLTVAPDAAEGSHVVQFIAEGPGGRFAAASATVEVVAPGSYAGTVAASSPVGYWRLGQPAGTVAHDVSGHAGHGTFTGAVTLGAVGALASDDDTAAELDGGYVGVPDATAVSVTGAFTLEAWIRPRAVGAQQGVIEKYDCHPCSNGYGLRLLPSGRLAAFTIGAGGAIGYVEGHTVVDPGAWHHVAAVYDGATMRIYLDGREDAVVPTTVHPTDGPADLKLGARGDDAAERLRGGLDEVAVYDRALTADEVREHHSVGTGTPSS